MKENQNDSMTAEQKAVAVRKSRLSREERKKKRNDSHIKGRLFDQNPVESNYYESAYNRFGST
jgi:hypothetical protein